MAADPRKQLEALKKIARILSISVSGIALDAGVATSTLTRPAKSPHGGFHSRTVHLVSEAVLRIAESRSLSPGDKASLEAHLTVWRGGLSTVNDCSVVEDEVLVFVYETVERAIRRNSLLVVPGADTLRLALKAYKILRIKHPEFITTERPQQDSQFDTLIDAIVLASCL